MVNDNFHQDRPHVIPNVSHRLKKSNSKIFPRLSLSLHTMPQTADSHFKKWLLLAGFVFFLMILVALIIFWH